MATIVNVLLSTLPGLGLPSTLLVPLPADLPIRAFADTVEQRIPRHVDNLVLYTPAGRCLDFTSSLTLSELSHGSDLLSLRLSAPLSGGKGGFGSQLRAAGGRMSSRKKRDNGNPNGSSRDLNGRRLHTIADAKILADYLATKPEMDKKQKEERRARWEAVVEAAEKREEEIKTGKKGVRLDGEWVDAKEEAESKTRDAVLAMMKAGLMDVDGPTGSESEEEDDDASEGQNSPAEASGSSGSGEAAGTRSFFGWEEEELSEDEDEDEGEETEDAGEAEQLAYKGKGKAKA